MLDLGANIGGTVVTWLEKGARTVHAVEPVPRNLEVLTARFAGADKVTVHACGISDAEGMLTSVNVYNAWTLLPDDATELDRALEFVDEPPFDVPLTTIDALVDATGIAPNVLKIDVDGYEAKALRGGREVLETLRPMVVFEISYLPYFLGDCCECMIRGIFDAGYVIADPDRERRFTDTRDVMRVYPWDTSFDVLLVPEEFADRY